MSEIEKQPSSEQIQSQEVALDIERHPAAELLEKLQPTQSAELSRRGEAHSGPEVMRTTYTIEGRQISFQSPYEQAVTSSMQEQSVTHIGEQPVSFGLDVELFENSDAAHDNFEAFEETLAHGVDSRGIVCDKRLESVLAAADEIMGSDANAERIVALQEGRYEAEDLHYIDAIIAASIIDPESEHGLLDREQQIDGEALVILAMTGDKDAEAYVEKCIERLQQIRAQRSSEQVDMNNGFAEHEEAGESLPVEEVAFVHVTDYAPSLNANGRLGIAPSAQSRGLARASIHVTANHEVEPVSSGAETHSWDDRAYSIIMPAEQALQQNGSPNGMQGAVDIWFQQNPGEQFELPEGSIIIAPETAELPEAEGVTVVSYDEKQGRKRAFTAAMEQAGYPTGLTGGSETVSAAGRTLRAKMRAESQPFEQLLHIESSDGSLEIAAINFQIDGNVDSNTSTWLAQASPAASRTAYEAGAIPSGKQVQQQRPSVEMRL